MKKRILSVLMALAMTVGMLPTYALATTAESNATVAVSFRQEGGYAVAKQQTAVSANLSDTYGYDDSVTQGVSTLDVLIRAHQLYFTAVVGMYDEAAFGEWLGAALVVKDGMVSTVFETTTYSFGFAVNGTAPVNTETIYPAGYGFPESYEGKLVNQAAVTDGDNVEFFIYDGDYANNYYSWFENEQGKAEKIETAIGQPLSLSLKGYLYAYNSAATDATLRSGTALDAMTIVTLDADTCAASPFDPAAATDSSGAFSVSFRDPGTYILSAKGTAASPLLGPWCVVEVVDPTPKFDGFAFLTTALTGWNNSDFSSDKFEYNLQIKNATTSTLTLSSATKYNGEKYTAVAEYTDAAGTPISLAVNNGKMTSLPKMPFGDSDLTITLQDKNDGAAKVVYTFHINRPYSATKTLKSNGIVIYPEGRDKVDTLYNGKAEGAFFRLDDSGAETGATGVTGAVQNYNVYLLHTPSAFRLALTGTGGYEHIRYSTDGSGWTAVASGDQTAAISAVADGSTTVKIQVISDDAYVNYAGFDKAENITEYTVHSICPVIDMESAQILTAQCTDGEWYPAFSGSCMSYGIAVPNGTTAGTLTYTASEGATVKLGTTVQTAQDGIYTLPLKTAAQTLTVTSADGKITNSYSFKLVAKSKYAVPDAVTDYLCINSQYTNSASYGMNPEQTLGGSLKSLGNFGGYITYYYKDAITDNPDNQYGIDFYVYGNSSEANIASMAEPGQTWVSEDGNIWYALAGSEHYEDGTLWDYSVTYTKLANGKTGWTDNYGNTDSGVSGSYPLFANYPLHSFDASDSLTLKGILLPSGEDGTITGTGTTGSYAAATKFGYADYYANGTIGADVNPYAENPSKSNGFDLAWAVDGNGQRVDVSNKEFHYVKVVNASNIWAGSFGEKSTEVAYVVKTAAQGEAVGQTAAPLGVTISDASGNMVVNFKEGQSTYAVDVGGKKYLSIAVNGAAAEDNIYVNNQRIAYNGAATGFAVDKSHPKTVRIIVQNGEKEPVVYLLNLTGTADSGAELLRGIYANVAGDVRAATKGSGAAYTLSVGNFVSSVTLLPDVATGTEIKVNGGDSTAVSLAEGDNSFAITATKDGQTQQATLTIHRAAAPTVSGEIEVSVTVLGDTKHTDGQVHIYKNGTAGFEMWVSSATYTIDAGSTAWSALKKALDANSLSYANASGNYISAVNGLGEFDNGIRSGWLYSVNGEYPAFGVGEYVLAQGDRIVLHYTDDYSKEKEIFEGSSNAGKNETNISEAFSDVDKNAWYYDSVVYVGKKGLMTGMGGGKFEPYADTSRAMLATILYRLAGSPPVTGRGGFADIADGKWYSDAVIWAQKNGIVNGIGDGTFGANGGITREQMAVMLYRYCALMKIDTSKTADMSGFADADKISPWAKDAIAWAKGANILTGIGANIAPDSVSSRCESAAMLMRFCESVLQ